MMNPNVGSGRRSMSCSSQHHLFNNRREKVGIIGTGNYGIALGKRLLEYGFQVIYGSRNPNKEYLEKCLKTKDNYQVEGISDAFLKADRIVFFAVSARSGIYENIVDNLNKAIQETQQHLVVDLRSKIVIDLSNKLKKNGFSNAERLQILLNEMKSLRESHFHIQPNGVISQQINVIKAFNNISAYSMSADYCEKKGTCEAIPIAGDDLDAKDVVIKFCNQIGFQAYDIGPLKKALVLENADTIAFPDWINPTLFTLLFVMFNFIWVFFIYFLFSSGSKSFAQYLADFSLLTHLNKVLGFSALQLLAYVYMASVVAAVYQLRNGTKYKRFPKYLELWLKSRKQLGLWAYLLTGMHVILSVLTTNQSYMSGWFKDASKFSKMTFLAELSLVLGIFAFAAMSIVALSSLSSVANSLNWREWRLVQSRIGLTCLVLATAHDVAMYLRIVTEFEKNHTIAYLVTRVKLYAMIVPIVVLVARFLFGYFPPLSARITRIRDGTISPVEESQVAEA